MLFRLTSIRNPSKRFFFSSLFEAIVVFEVKFQKEQLQIDDTTMKAHTEIFGPEFKERLERDASIGMKKFLISEVTLSALLLAEIAASELVEDALKFIPILANWV